MATRPRPTRVVLLVGALALLATACDPGTDVSVVTTPDDESSASGSEDTDTATSDTATSDSGATSDTGGSGSATPDPDTATYEHVDLPGLVDTSDDAITDDTIPTTGTLDNGLTYYVRTNDNPGSKASVQLAVRAGSVDESGAAGVAHFTEHMLFNGTEEYPENELIDVLRGFGAEFGPDVNAYTSFDETVYQLTVPNTPDAVGEAISVLEQWLSHATFDEAQVVAERGVVLDEWRVRTQSVDGRLFDVAQELYLDGSAYEDRSPIGTSESIESMSQAELRTFYDAWYRPDNAAVIVVGEIDPDTIVDLIEEQFGPAAPRTDEMPERPDTSFPIDTTSEFGLHSDPDQLTVDVEVTLPLPATEGDGTAALRADLIDRMIYDTLVRRLSRDVSAGVAPFDDIVPGSNSFVETFDAPALYAFTDEERVGDTLVALLDEYERAARFGFDEQEVATAAATVMAGFDTRYDGRESTQDTAYADQYVANFLAGTPYPSIDDEHAIVGDIVAAVTPEAMTTRFVARWTNSAPDVIISTPEAFADRMPSEAEVLAAIDAVASRDLDPRPPAAAAPDHLMQRPEPVEAVSVEQLLDQGFAVFDPIELTYPNGARVIVTSNDIVEGVVTFSASSPGGSSLIADDDVVDALYAADIVTSGGVGDLDQATLDEVLARSDLTLGAYTTPYLDNFAGTVAAADVETLFELVNQYITAPRFDEIALNQIERRYGPAVDDPASDPELAGYDAYADARYPGELRYAALPTPDEFATLDLDGVERVWRARYGDPSDWVFVFTGDAALDTLIELADAYIGSLPGTGTEEAWVNVAAPAPSGVVSTTVEAGTGETAKVTIHFATPLEPEAIDGRTRITAELAAQVIDARLTDVIREEFGATYSPFSMVTITTDPDPVIETYVEVSGAPDGLEAISELVVLELTDLAAGGMTDAEFANADAQVVEQTNYVSNAMLNAELINSSIHPGFDLDDFLGRFEWAGAIPAGDVTAFIGRHVPVDRYIEVQVAPR